MSPRVVRPMQFRTGRTASTGRPNACPECGKPVSISTGRRRYHRDQTGVECPGSGQPVHTSRGKVTLTELPPVELTEPARLAPLPPRGGSAGPRPPRHPAQTCQVCGRKTPVRNDGRYRDHRQWADDPAAPHCPASRQVAT